MKKTNLLGTTLFSLALLASCNSVEETPGAFSTLQVKVTNTTPESRAIVTGTTLPAGSEIGVTLLDAAGQNYDDVPYANLKYTTDNGTDWAVSGTTAPLLSSTDGKAIAYYPWKDAADYTALAVETASQTDYMYSGWVEGINNSAPEASFTMNHGLSAFRVILKKEDAYKAAATATTVSVKSDAFVASAKMNAVDGTLSAWSGDGDVTVDMDDITLSTSDQYTDIMVVPAEAAGTEATFTVAVADAGSNSKNYTVDVPFTTAMLQGKCYQFTLTLTATGFEASTVAVTEWGQVQNAGSGDMKPLGFAYGTIDLTTAPNGVYAVAKNGKGVTFENADETCIAVALIQDRHRFWIEKKYFANYFYNWHYDNNEDLSIPNYTYANASNKTVYLPRTNDSYFSTPHLSRNYTSWTRGAVSDFNGKSNSAVLVKAAEGKSVIGTSAIGTMLKRFNAAIEQNQGCSDWYIPSAGQNSLMFLHVTEINKFLEKIGGVTIVLGNHWTSTEKSDGAAFSVNFKTGAVSSYDSGGDMDVRFIRDVLPTPDYITFIVNDVVYVAEEGMTWQQYIASQLNYANIVAKNSRIYYNDLYMSFKFDVVEPDDVIQEGVYTLGDDNPWHSIANGVYAVGADGLPVAYAKADASCIGVALIVNDAPTPQYMMIEKTQDYHETSTGFTWKDSNYDFQSVPNYDTADGTNEFLYFKTPYSPLLNKDYKTWLQGAMSDFGGKNNTNNIIGSSNSDTDMGKVTRKFNDGSYGKNQGYDDWYVPALGQLALIYLNLDEVNSMMEKIGGTLFQAWEPTASGKGPYWSSSERDSHLAWQITFCRGQINSSSYGGSKDGKLYIRLIRDLL